MCVIVFNLRQLREILWISGPIIYVSIVIKISRIPIARNIVPETLQHRSYDGSGRHLRPEGPLRWFSGASLRFLWKSLGSSWAPRIARAHFFLFAFSLCPVCEITFSLCQFPEFRHQFFNRFSWIWGAKLASLAPLGSHLRLC